MGELDTGALRERLEAERERLIEEIAELERVESESLSEASGENVYRDHMADLGTATFERDLDMTLEVDAREQLREVEAAVARLDAGDYGVCAECGATIPSQRLDAMPTAALCLACKETQEGS